MEEMMNINGVYAGDQFDALKTLDSELSSLGIGSEFDKKLSFIDRVIHSNYLEMQHPIAFEIKNAIESYSLIYRLTNFLYRIEKESKIRSVIFVIYDACGTVNLDEINIAINPFRNRFDIKILDFENYTKKKVRMNLNRQVFSALLDTSYSRLDIEKLDIFSDSTGKVVSDKKKQDFENFMPLQGITLCLGAGVSKSAGMPDWNNLIDNLWFKEVQGRVPFKSLSIEDLSRELINIVGDSPLIRAATLAKVSGYGLAEKIRNFIYSTELKESELISSICNLISLTRSKNTLKVLTFNYDNLIELNLERLGIKTKAVYNNDGVDLGLFPIFHVHGYLPPVPDIIKEDHEKSLVFSENSYHSQFYDYYSWSNILLFNSFCETSCIFIGCSMIDPNLRRLLEFSQKQIRRKKHYAFLRLSNTSNDNIETKFAKRRIIQSQEFALLDLGVEIIWIKEFSEIPTVLEQIQKKMLID
jgi:SIR2-like domain